MVDESERRHDIPALPEPGMERDALQFIHPGFYIRQPPPPHELDTFITPDVKLFQTLHLGTTVVDETKYMLVVDGLVERPFAITLEKLRKLPRTSTTAFHECYGSPLKPPTEALWRIGNVKWTGVQLSHLLSLAGFAPSDETQFIWSDGLDRGEFAGVGADRYQKDLPLAKALQPEVLVAYEMNGEPLKPDRGGPVRLVVPGYFGTNSTKWLCRLSVQTERAKGPFTTTFYNEADLNDPQSKTTKPVWQLQVNSMITRPTPGQVFTEKTIAVEGWAWSDHGILSVGVTADGGQSWSDAQVSRRSEYEWQRFETRLELCPGEYTIMARARSKSGEQQPLVDTRNHVHSVTVKISSND
ncbi:molybdopterin binding oxidoreductase [Plenodomus tracheiphilus IPT5]|uniref:Molybdopterin binding oxidoreductase n=1 Tax=Plenodomus tracheiphilus IPT5 TaxID=1408161 RepID=A0A6A7B6F6_9PLEO|nr:molybdopterin binding oxidoreductase [Plenodomus tracheiphilus IPT5]